MWISVCVCVRMLALVLLASVSPSLKVHVLHIQYDMCITKARVLVMMSLLELAHGEREREKNTQVTKET